ncbi:MAG: bacillithiol biosynthesis BshC, partial [Planctomycetota bacterium]
MPRSLFEAYRPGRSPAECFRRTLDHVLAGQGLLTLDPRCEGVAHAALPVHRWALSHHESIARALVARTVAIKRAGFRPALRLRPECALSFFHPDGPGGPRHRVVPSGRSWGLSGRSQTLSPRRLLARIEQDPRCVSTSALLRPLVQDAVLPTAAYVAGLGECGYFAQLAPLYPQAERAMPLVVPRWSATWLATADRERLEAMGLAPQDVDPRARGWLAKAVRHRSAHGRGPTPERVSTWCRALDDQRKELDGLGARMSIEF